MGAAFRRIDAVGEREDVFRIGVVVLQRHFNNAVFPLSGDEDRILVKQLLAPVEIFDERYDSTPIAELALAIRPLVKDRDLHARVEKGQLAQAIRQGVITELDILEDLLVRPERDLGPPRLGIPHPLQRGCRNAACVRLGINAAVPSDLQFQIGG